MREAAELAVRLRATGTDEVRERLRGVGEDASFAFERVQRSTYTAQSDISSLVEKTASGAGSVVGFVEGAFSKVAGLITGVASAAGAVATKVIEIGGAFGVAGGLATAGIGGLVYAARQYTQGVAESISSTSDLASEFGVTVEAMTRMQAAFRVNGADGDKLGTALSTMKLKVVDLASGTQSAVDAFGNLGGLKIENFRNADGSLKGTREQLDILLDRLERVKNPTLQSKSALDIFGASAKEMGTLIGSGSAGLRAAEKDVERYGTTLKGASSDALTEALAAQSRLQESLRGVGYTLTRIFFPFFVESSDGLSKWLNDNQTRIEGWLTKLKGVAVRIRTDIVNVFGMLVGGATTAVGAAAAATGASFSPASFTAEEGDDEDEDGKPKGYLTERHVQRQAIINGRMVDLDNERAKNAELAAERIAIVNGKSVNLQTEVAEKAKESGRRLAEVDGKMVDLDAKRAGLEQVGARRFAEVNGQRVELAVKRINLETGKLGQGSAFNFPIFGTIASTLGTVRTIVGDVVSALQGKAVSGIIGFFQTASDVATRAGRAIGAFASYIYQGVTGGASQLLSFTDVFKAVGRAFTDFRLGLERGFRTPWAQSLKAAADNVLATFAGLLPLIQSAVGSLGGLVTSLSGPLASLTGGMLSLVRSVAQAGSAFIDGPLADGLAKARLGAENFLGFWRGFGKSFFGIANREWSDGVLPIVQYVADYGQKAQLFSTEFGDILVSVATSVAAFLQNGLRTADGFLGGALTSVRTFVAGIASSFTDLSGGALASAQGNFGTIFFVLTAAVMTYLTFARRLPILVGSVWLGIAGAMTTGLNNIGASIDVSKLWGVISSIPGRILASLTGGMSESKVVAAGSGLPTGMLSLAQQVETFIRIHVVSINGLAENGIKAVSLLVGGYQLFFGSTRGALYSLGAFLLSFGLRFIPQLTYSWVQMFETGGQQLRSSGASLVRQVGLALEGESGPNAARVEKAGLPFLALGGMPGIAARLFGSSWIRMQVQYAMAWRQIASFGKSVIGLMAQVGEWIGLTPVGGPAALGALTVALVAAAGYASGALSLLTAVIFTAVAGLALLFYGTTIAAVGLKLLMDVVLFSTRILLGLAIVMSYAARVGFVAFAAMFAGIRTIAIAFWGFMALGPAAFAARMTAMYVAVAARTVAFAAFMTLANLGWVFGVIAIVVGLIAALIYMTTGFDGLAAAWAATCDFLVAAFGFSMNALQATSAGLKDLFTEPAKFWSTLFEQFWEDFKNLGIDAWNGIKAATGLDLILGKTANVDRVKSAYRDAAGANADLDVNPRGEEIRKKREAAAGVKRRDTAFVDPFPGVQDDDVIEDGAGGYSSKRELVARLKADLKRRDDATYAAEVSEAQRKAIAPPPKKAAPGAAAAPGTPGATAADGGMFGMFKGGLGSLKELLFPTMPALPGADGKGAPEGMIDTLLKGFGGGGGKDPIEDLAAQMRKFGEGKPGGFPGGGTDTIGDKDKSGTGEDGRPRQQRGIMDLMLEGLTQNKKFLGGAYPQPDATPEKRADNGFDLTRFLAAFGGLGEGPATKTPYATSPQKVAAGEEVEPLTPLERTAARDRATDAARAARDKEREDALAGKTKVVAATVQIAEGDKRLFGTPEAFAALTKAMSEFGLRAVVDQPRTT